MDKVVTSATACHRFRDLMRGVRRGDSYVITSQGRPIARLSPVEPQADLRDAAQAVLFQRLARQAASDVGPWARTSLYER